MACSVGEVPRRRPAKKTQPPSPPLREGSMAAAVAHPTAPARVSISVSDSLSSLPPSASSGVSERLHVSPQSSVGLEKTLCSDVVSYAKSPPLSSLCGGSNGESLPCPPRRRCNPWSPLSPLLPRRRHVQVETAGLRRAARNERTRGARAGNKACEQQKKKRKKKKRLGRYPSTYQNNVGTEHEYISWKSSK